MKTNLIKVFFIFSLLLVFGCTEKKTPIRIGVNDWPPCEVWYIAQKQGFFENVPVQIVRYSTWSDNMKSLYVGNIDITHSTYFNAVFLDGKGEDSKIILSSDTIVGGDGLAVKKSIKTLQDLKDKAVAVEVNTDEHFLLHKTLQKSGVSLQDIKIVNAASSEGKELFISGKVDAVYTYEPYLSQAAEQGNGYVFTTTKKLPGYMVDALVARDEVIDNRSSDLKTILHAWFKALEYINNNPENSFRLMAENEKMPLKDFEAFFNSFKFFSKEENLEIYNSNKLKNVIAEMAEFTDAAINNVDDIYSIEILNE